MPCMQSSTGSCGVGLLATSIVQFADQPKPTQQHWQQQQSQQHSRQHWQREHQQQQLHQPQLYTQQPHQWPLHPEPWIWNPEACEAFRQRLDIMHPVRQDDVVVNVEPEEQ